LFDIKKTTSGVKQKKIFSRSSFSPSMVQRMYACAMKDMHIVKGGGARAKKTNKKISERNLWKIARARFEGKFMF